MDFTKYARKMYGLNGIMYKQMDLEKCVQDLADIDLRQASEQSYIPELAEAMREELVADIAQIEIELKGLKEDRPELYQQLDGVQAIAPYYYQCQIREDEIPF